MSKRVLAATAFLICCALSAAAQSPPRRARNVILFLADAGGIPTLHAASLYGYRAPQKLHIQTWPHVGLSETSPADGFVTDSANGMTAIVTGVKTMNGVISQGPDAVRNRKDGRPLKTVLEYAEEQGLRTGVVTDQAVTDATPAACYAHSNERSKWGEIFSQAFAPRFGDGVDVLIGAGRIEIETQLRAKGASFEALSASSKRLISPTLEEAKPQDGRLVVVAQAIDVRAASLRALDELKKGPKGYFLMVEWDAHTPDPKAGLDRLVAFDNLVKEIQSKVDLNDTLLLFTADHSYALRVRGGGVDDPILAGYDEWKAAAVRGQPGRLKNILVDDSHTGEEVAAIAIGAGSERVSGFFPNTRLFHVMMDAWGFKADAPAPR
jgi:alkaline phosphatase